MNRSTAGPFPIVVFLSVGLVAGIAGFTAASGFTHSRALVWISGLAAAAAAIAWTASRPGLGALLAAVPRSFQIAFAVGAALALGQLAVLTPFMVDPNSTTWRDGPLRPMSARHSCVSAYWVAAEKATSVPDIYVESVYRPPPPPTGLLPPNMGPLVVDAYEYPPTFLPLPRLLARLTGDFWGFRKVWFALNLAGVALGLVLIARRFDAALGTHTLWLTPWALAAPSMIGTLQVGNVQLLFIVMSAVAMLLFERRRHVLGGAVLGYAIASKLYPGVFVVYLLLRRDWRALAWTAVSGIVLTIVTLLDIGWTPMAAFLEHLPKILSGEAFPALYRPPAIALNESIPGVVFKLGLLGVPNMGFPAARLVGWLYTVVLLFGIFRLASRARDPRLEPAIWLAILIQATLRSPFLPSYGAFPSLWLATLLAGLAWARPSARALVALGWLVLAFHFGQSNSLVANGVASSLHTVVELILAFYVAPRLVAGPAPDARAAQA